MPAVCPQDNLFQTEYHLHQFLLQCQQVVQERGRPQFVSLVRPCHSPDPLGLLQTIGQPNRLHFYIEHRHSLTMAAVDAVASCQVQGPERFRAVQNFIRRCLLDTIMAGPPSYQGPYFCSSFTFFPQPHLPAPFPGGMVFLPRWQVIRFPQGTDGPDLGIINLRLGAEDQIAILAQQTWQDFHRLQQARYQAPTPGRRSLYHLTYPNREFKNQVETVLKGIQGGDFTKVVLAQAVDLTAPGNFNGPASLANFRQQEPACYVFSVGNGRGHTFLGASPEKLLRVDQGQLTTDALAGSAPRGVDTADDQLLAASLLVAAKERREHQLVRDFIIQHLEALGLRTTPLTSPLVLKLAQIQHLHTVIKAGVPPGLTVLELLGHLHPTPAMAGSPRAAACALIRRIETFERSLYAAPLGWTDAQGNGEFIVGIRSALIQGNRARLFSGAGIVAGSDPASELAEVELKLQPMLKGLA